MKKVSFIIPSYNSWKTVGRTLESIARQRSDLVSEVLVVDSSSDGRTRQVLSRYAGNGLPLRVIDAGVRVMPAVGRNIGARAAKGDILAFVDSDAYLAPDWLEKIVERCQQGCRVGGGSIALPESQLYRPIPVAQYFLQFNEYMDIGRSRVKPFLPSCNMFCDRELFRQCGGFPEIRASEDVLFFLKAGRKAPVWFIPEAKVFHIFREEAAPFLKNQMLLGRYIIVYRRRAHPDRFYYRGAWPFLFLPAFAAIKVGRITRRVLLSRPSLLLRYFAVLPLFAAGMIAWCAGFVQGVFSRE